MLVFEEGGKPENPEKNPRSKGENQQQTQPTYMTPGSGIVVVGTSREGIHRITDGGGWKRTSKGPDGYTETI